MTRSRRPLAGVGRRTCPRRCRSIDGPLSSWSCIMPDTAGRPGRPRAPGRSSVALGRAHKAALPSKLAMWMFPFGVLVFGGALPVGLIMYWVSNNAWTFGQQHVILNRIAKEGHEKKRQTQAVHSGLGTEAGAKTSTAQGSRALDRRKRAEAGNQRPDSAVPSPSLASRRERTAWTAIVAAGREATLLASPRTGQCGKDRSGKPNAPAAASDTSRPAFWTLRAGSAPFRRCAWIACRQCCLPPRPWWKPFTCRSPSVRCRYWTTSALRSSRARCWSFTVRTAQVRPRCCAAWRAGTVSTPVRSSSAAADGIPGRGSSGLRWRAVSVPVISSWT